MRQASEAVVAARYADAIRSYGQVVRRDPDNALAHFELALLLQDNRQDDAGALYHYRTFLELQPNADKAPIARDRLKAVEARLGRRYGGGGGGGARATTDAQIVARIEELNGEVADREQTIRQLRDQIALLTKENDRLGKEVKSLSHRVDIMLNSGSAGSRTPSSELARRALDEGEGEATRPAAHARSGASASPPPMSPGARKYRVKRGDSLWSIAQKVYGDASRNRDIRNANRGRIGPSDKLTEGDDLVIPMP
jgi:uncharacterized coiled-coil protein SlyX